MGWLFEKLFFRYERLELRCVSYLHADAIFRCEPGVWRIAPEEDRNYGGCVVFIERVKRVPRFWKAPTP
jgi:hypothetical protein